MVKILKSVTFIPDISHELTKIKRLYFWDILGKGFYKKVSMPFKTKKPVCRQGGIPIFR